MNDGKAKRRIWFGAAAAVLLTVGFSVPFIRCIRDPAALRGLLDSFGVLAPLMFVLLSMLQILIPFIPGEPFELLAGYAFGAAEGTLLCFVSGCLASFIILCVVKRYGSRVLRLFFKKTDVDRLKWLRSEKSFLLFAVLFLLPGTPKDLLCYAGGLSGFDFVPMFLVVTVGRLPSIVTSTVPAGALGSGKTAFAIAAYAAAALICLGGLVLYRRVIAKKKQAETEED